MAKVDQSLENQAEQYAKAEKLPPNAVAEVTDAFFAQVSKDGFTKTNGEAVPPSKRTEAIVTFVVPDGPEPTKVYTHNLGVGEYLMPSEDGTWLDDFLATTDKQKKLQPTCGWAVFKNSLRQVGEPNGVVTRVEEAALTDSIKALVGTVFTVGYSERDGGPAIGKYSALVASQVHRFGKGNVNADMDAVVAQIGAVLAMAPPLGFSAAELVGKLHLTGAQMELAKQSFGDANWIGQAEAAKVLKRTTTGRFVKA